jgi:mRNA-degrading endonuclease toxin of MazEF toxin-antitoxin module
MAIDYCRPCFDVPFAEQTRPTVVEIQGGIGGLPELSFAVCHQIATLDRAKLTKKMGTVQLDVLKAIEEGVKAALDLE